MWGDTQTEVPHGVPRGAAGQSGGQSMPLWFEVGGLWGSALLCGGGTERGGVLHRGGMGAEWGRAQLLTHSCVQLQTHSPTALSSTEIQGPTAVCSSSTHSPTASGPAAPCAAP